MRWAQGKAITPRHVPAGPAAAAMLVGSAVANKKNSIRASPGSLINAVVRAVLTPPCSSLVLALIAKLKLPAAVLPLLRAGAQKAVRLIGWQLPAACHGRAHHPGLRRRAGRPGAGLAPGWARHATPAAARHHRHDSGAPCCCPLHAKDELLRSQAGSPAALPPCRRRPIQRHGCGFRTLQAGVASGPQALGLLGPLGLQSLAPVQHLCLSLIALSAGAELHLPELRRLRKQVLCRSAGCRLQHCVGSPMKGDSLLPGCSSPFIQLAGCQ